MNKNADSLSGTRLTPAQYFDDYRARYAKIGGTTSWKLERRQSFSEPDDDSWREFDRGNWETSLARFKDRVPQLRANAREDAERGIELYRVRVVGEPIGPYLLWELNALKVRGECGEKIRVINAAMIAELERDDELPEILTLGEEAVYQILYDDSGELQGAIRSTKRSDVESWTEFIAGLYLEGEDIDTFFARRVAGRKPSHAA